MVIVTKKTVSPVPAIFLLCSFLCFDALTAYPYHATQMHRSRDNITIDLISDIHAENEVHNIQALDSSLDAYRNAVIQLNQAKPLSLIWEHTSKIYLIQGDTFDTYDKQDRLMFDKHIRPYLPIETFMREMDLDITAATSFKALYDGYTDDNIIFGKNLAEEPRGFMNRLALQFRTQQNIPFFAADAERFSMLSYAMLGTVLEENLAPLQELGNSGYNKQLIETIKNNTCSFLINVFILIHKILLAETVPDHILAAGTTLSHRDAHDIKKMWAAYKKELFHFYTHTYRDLVKLFFSDANNIEPDDELIAISNGIIELDSINDLIRDSMVEYELLFSALTAPTHKKIIYAGGYHCASLVQKLTTLGFVTNKEIGPRLDDETINGWFAYTSNTKKPTYALDDGTLVSFTHELELATLQQFLA